jgi:DNA repair protein RecO (recombination protein O)
VLKVEQQPAYLLHSRPYRETSLLADFITRDYGRLSAVVRGKRGGKRKRSAEILQSFIPLTISWSGRSSLKTLIAYENCAAAELPSGQRLYSALYCNELLMKLTMPFDHYPGLFDHYESLLAYLASDADIESGLRGFELELLDMLGYGIDLSHDHAHEAISPERRYVFNPEAGLIPDPQTGETAFSGSLLEKIRLRDFSEPQTKKAAKMLMRQVFDFLLAGKPITARELFRKS